MFPYQFQLLYCYKPRMWNLQILRYSLGIHLSNTCRPINWMWMDYIYSASILVYIYLIRLILSIILLGIISSKYLLLNVYNNNVHCNLLYALAHHAIIHEAGWRFTFKIVFNVYFMKYNTKIYKVKSLRSNFSAYALSYLLIKPRYTILWRSKVTCMFPLINNGNYYIHVVSQISKNKNDMV